LPEGTPEFLQRNLPLVRNLPNRHPVLFRLDGGNDAVDTIRAFVETKDGTPFSSLRGIRALNPSSIGMNWRKRLVLKRMIIPERTCTPERSPEQYHGELKSDMGAEWLPSG